MTKGESNKEEKLRVTNADVMRLLRMYNSPL